MKSGETRGSEWLTSSAWRSAAERRDNRSDILEKQQLAMGWVGRLRGKAISLFGIHCVKFLFELILERVKATSFITQFPYTIKLFYNLLHSSVYQLYHYFCRKTLQNY